jgi:DNA recombination protein RmuC
MVIAFALVLGAVLGVAAAYWLLRPALRERAEAQADLRTVERELAMAESRLETSDRTFDERVTNAIKAVSAEALRENSSAFAEQAMHRLDQYVKPLKESLDKVETNVQTLEQARRQAYGELHKELETLRAGQDRLRTETGNLVTALRTPHVRGRWGEIQLKRVVEMAGMLSHCDFVEQQTTSDEEGRVLRPDLVVRLPGGKSIVVDSKVPLPAYLDALREDASDDERRARLADHARTVRDHIHKLGQKAYWRQLPATPEFVVMFLPDETFFRAALEVDPALIEIAVANNVIPASPTNLIGLLRAVHYGWQQETIAESAREISDLGRELYKRLSTMGAHMARVGKSLDGAVKAYNETVGSLERQVLPQARKFERHGITGVEPPELVPIERQARALAAPELVDASEPLELPLAQGTHAA